MYETMTQMDAYLAYIETMLLSMCRRACARGTSTHWWMTQAFMWVLVIFLSLSTPHGWLFTLSLKGTIWLSLFLGTCCKLWKIIFWPRKKREDFWIYRQETNQPRDNVGNAPLDEHFEVVWKNHNNDEEETSDESPCDDSSPKEAWPQEVDVINVEEQGTKDDILVTLTSSTRKLRYQSKKRRAEK